jgi:hypothetical protein
MPVVDKDLIGMWYVQIDSMSDWMGYLKKEPDGVVSVEYRFRYYDRDDPDNDAHSDKDTKSWGGAHSKMEPAEAIEYMRFIANAMCVMGGKMYEVLMHDGDTDRFMRELSEQPFAHVKKYPIQ